MIGWLRAIWCLLRHERYWLDCIEGREEPGRCRICSPKAAP